MSLRVQSSNQYWFIDDDMRKSDREVQLGCIGSEYHQDGGSETFDDDMGVVVVFEESEEEGDIDMEEPNE